MTFDSTFLSRETFLAFRNRFHSLAKQRALTPSEVVLHNIIRQLPADRGFTAVTNPVKLANGAASTHAFITAKAALIWGNFRNQERFKAAYGFDIPSEEFKRLYGVLINSK